MVEVLPRLAKCFADGDGGDGLLRTLEALIRRNRDVKHDIAFAAILDDGMDNAAIRDCMHDFVHQNGTLRDVLTNLGFFEANGIAEEEKLNRVRGVLKRLAKDRPGYVCQDCGYAGSTLYWQCPGCNAWDTTRPNTGFRFENLLVTAAQ